MQVKAVLFDLFDTLLLIEKGEEFYEPSLKKLHETLARNGINVAFEDFKRIYFEVRDELYYKASENLEEPHFNIRISQTLKRLGYNLNSSNKVVAEATKAFANKFACYVRLDEDAPEILQKLHRKYKLGMVSNFAIPECIWDLLEKFDLKKFFDIVVISGEINRRKPSPEIFQKALRKLGVDSHEAVFVGDTPGLDIKGAKAIAMNAILIQRKTSTTDVPNSFIWRPPENNMEHKPDRIIKRLKELPEIMEDC
ncbi:HAD family hydrolase [Candidatus Bathyarchaeota archaeon]|nr:HAD family hydrolase [Candidatus Bathyarchaeota archaeon]